MGWMLTVETSILILQIISEKTFEKITVPSEYNIRKKARIISKSERRNLEAVENQGLSGARGHWCT